MNNEATEHLLERLEQGLFTLDKDGLLIAINDAGARALGFANGAELLGDREFGWGLFVNQPEGAELFAEARAGATGKKRFVLIRRNGTPLIVEVALEPGSRNGVPIVHGLFRDITASEELARNLVERNIELEALRRLAVEAVFNQEPADLLLSMLRICVEAVGADGGVIYTYDPEIERLMLTAHHSVDPSFLEGVRTLQLEQGFTGKAAASRSPVLIDDIGTHPDNIYPRLRAIGMRNFFSFPLLAQERLLGVLNLFTMGEREFSARNFGLLRALAAQLSLSLDHILGIETLRERNEELEKFNMLAVDRELRMVELKRRIRELEASLSDSEL